VTSPSAAGDQSGTDEASPLQVGASAAPLAERWRLAWKSFAFIVIAVLAALAATATLRHSETMLTRISIGILIALALDPVVSSVERRFNGRRGLAAAIVALLVLGAAALLVGVLGPRAVAEIRQFSEQFPETVGQLEQLPLVGGWIEDQNLQARAEDWVSELPEQFTDERLESTAQRLVTGLASVAIVTVVAISVLIDGENLVHRFRRLLRPTRRAQADEVGRVVYRTIGRYIGGSVTVAVMMGLYVMTVGLILGVPLVPLAAIWAMLTDLIPQVGGFLGGAFFVLLAATESVPVAIAAAALFVVYMNLENHVIQPAIVGKSVDLTPPTTMVAAFVGGAVGGIPGALVATPLVGAAKQLILEARGRRGPEPPIDENAEGVVGRVRRQIEDLLPGDRSDESDTPADGPRD
jgi:predicted PurR-regulated permease PerM